MVGQEVLTLTDLPTPAPKAGEVLVKLSAIGVNYIDTYHRTGFVCRAITLRAGFRRCGGN